MNASTVTTPRCEASVLVAVQEHACSETDREVGGILVGRIDGPAVVSASIPALRAVGGSANVTFTHEVWEEALTIVDRDHPGEQIVGWYHSHPGFGVFLSEYDQFIQRNFFGSEGMVALVVDPLGGEAGWFVSIDGEIEAQPTFPTRSVPSAASELGVPAETRSKGIRPSQALLYGAVTVVAGFAVGWFLAPDGSTNPSSPIAALDDEAATTTVPADEPADEPASAPEPSTPWDLRYVVRSGDSIALLAQRFYGTSEAVPAIVAANTHIADPNLISVGDELILPSALGRGEDGLPVLDAQGADE
jgi:proteasome lid subunit RPN8/RPN11